MGWFATFCRSNSIVIVTVDVVPHLFGHDFVPPRRHLWNHHCDSRAKRCATSCHQHTPTSTAHFQRQRIDMCTRIPARGVSFLFAWLKIYWWVSKLCQEKRECLHGVNVDRIIHVSMCSHTAMTRTPSTTCRPTLPIASPLPNLRTSSQEACLAVLLNEPMSPSGLCVSVCVRPSVRSTSLCCTEVGVVALLYLARYWSRSCSRLPC